LRHQAVTGVGGVLRGAKAQVALPHGRVLSSGQAPCSQQAARTLWRQPAYLQCDVQNAVQDGVEAAQQAAERHSWVQMSTCEHRAHTHKAADERVC
jgi:hypothetical protein